MNKAGQNIRIVKKSGTFLYHIKAVCFSTSAGRNFKCELMLRIDTGKTSMLKLKIYDKEDMLNPIYMKDVINNTLIEPEF